MKKNLFMTLTLVLLTFGFWLTALVTAGWRISSEMKPFPPVRIMAIVWKNLSTEPYFMNNTLLEQLIEGRVLRAQVTKYSDSIFYMTKCTYERKNGYPTNKCFSNTRSRDSTNGGATDLTWTEMQIHFAAFVVVLVLCLISFTLLVKNSKSPPKVLAGGIVFFIAVVLELTLVIRWIILNMTTNKYYNSIENLKFWTERKMFVSLKFPYSILLAGQGLIFSAMVLPFTFLLYKKLRQNTTSSLNEEENETLN
ncbi:uncharacterized protein LOC133187871 [Saccostrea echinata]|uniref:uncharacterized protein LOC133187871 n=1 Tax=Saccostrea echinata TaxID=191078 RepID=UPI002A8171AC|nr:uncharacterized protein LOC133187871 [Saccostrea echinata]XP_061179247.1 uncharacterized protein LOC133187871 [Saccostrea echinata]